MSNKICFHFHFGLHFSVSEIPSNFLINVSSDMFNSYSDWKFVVMFLGMSGEDFSSSASKC